MTAIPNTVLKTNIKNGKLKIPGLQEDDIQPSSIDFRFSGGDFYKMGMDVPYINEELKNGRFLSKRGDLSDGFVLDPGVSYLFPMGNLENHTRFPATIDNKSTSGRLGMFSEVILGEMEYQRKNVIPTGYSGPVYTRVRSRAFPIEFKEGDAIMQLRFHEPNSGSLSHWEIDGHYGGEISVYDGDELVPANKVIRGNKTLLTVDVKRSLLQRDDGQVNPIVYRKPESAEILDYFKILINDGPMLRIHPKRLYLLGTNERVVLGANICGLMGLKTRDLGEHIETHRAGFFDNGFNATATCEHFSHEDIRHTLHQGQQVSYLEYESMTEPPDNVYDGHYQGQVAPLPSKQFKGYKNVWGDVENGKLDAKMLLK